MSAVLRQLAAIGCHRLLFFCLILWLIVFVLTAFPMLGTNISNVDTKTSDRLARAIADLQVLRQQNDELRSILKDITINHLNEDQKEVIENFQKRLTKVDSTYKKTDIGFISPKDEPNTQYELQRRRIYSNVKEFWNYIYSNLLDIQKKAKDVAPDVVESVSHVLSLGTEHKRMLLHDIEQLAEVDGYSGWREREAQDLSDVVQERFKFLQNPSDCGSAKKLVCNLNKGCGYGCQLHHATYCFMVAYGTKRTLILKSKGWRYHKAGWEGIFKPISETCTTSDGKSISNWPGQPETQVLNLPIIDSVNPRPPFLPLAVPEDLAPRLIRLHGDPIVWWVGQILKYFLRPLQKTEDMIQKAMANMGFKRPIVGVHVRRTDKVGTEAAFHRLEEYMAGVDEYYRQLEYTQTVDKRRVYLASDDPKVIIEAKSKYPQYEVLGDPQIAKTASVASRYSENSLSGIIIDIHMLSLSDYLICTFSSQVCRTAYEIMQVLYPDASSRFKSLDDIYYYGGQNPHNVVAVVGHEPKKPGEMVIAKGDIIGIAGNHWDGFSKGRNLRTNQIGLYPGFKTKDKVETAKFPTYTEVSLKREVDSV